jgi:hypothetical protein
VEILNLYAEIQVNPRSQVAYRRLADYYEAQGQLNEAQAFRDLAKRLHDNSPPSDEEQRQDNQASP